MAQTVTAFDLATGTRNLIVEVHADLDIVPEDVIRAFARRLFLRGVHVGLVMTPSQVLVLRDTLSSLEFSDTKYEVRAVDTAPLLRHARLGSPEREEGAFTRQVVQWLEAIGSSWYTFLHESGVRALVPHVVGRVADVQLETWDGILETHDAAE